MESTWMRRVRYLYFFKPYLAKREYFCNSSYYFCKDDSKQVRERAITPNFLCLSHEQNLNKTSSWRCRIQMDGSHEAMRSKLHFVPPPTVSFIIFWVWWSIRVCSFPRRLEIGDKAVWRSYWFADTKKTKIQKQNH